MTSLIRAAACSLAVFMCFIARSEWPKPALQHVEQYEDEFVDADFPLIWGLIKYDNIKLGKFPEAKVHKVKSDFFESGSLPTVLALQRDANGRPRRAPLMIIVSGFFTDHLSDLTLAERLYQRGYHVLTLPTGLSTPYIASRPKFFPGDLYREAQTILDLARSARSEIGEHLVSKLHYFGESYGATLGMIAKAYDAYSPKPILNGETTLLAPIFDIGHALNVFDSLMKDLDENRLERKVFWGQLLVYFDVKGAKRPAEVSPWIRSFSRPIVASKTRGNLARAIRAIQRYYPKQMQANGRPLVKDLRRINFAQMLEAYAPQILERFRSKAGKFFYWYEKARKANPECFVRVLGAVNDPLNSQAHSSRCEGESSIVMLPSGGHFGFLSSPWFERLIQVMD